MNMADNDAAPAAVQLVPAPAPAPAANANAASTARLPDFWEPDPALWFLTCEGIFATHRVTRPMDKYNLAISKLPFETLTTARDLMETAAALPDAYAALKGRLLGSYGRSKWAKLNELVDLPAACTSRPSILLRKMLSLLPPGERPGDLFRILFMRRMPANIRDALGSRDYATPHEMAAEADRMWDTRPETATVAAAGRPDRSPSPCRGQQQQQSRQPRDRRQQSQGQRKDRAATPGPDGRLCFYHQKWGSSAEKCRPPCSYQEN